MANLQKVTAYCNSIYSGISNIDTFSILEQRCRRVEFMLSEIWKIQYKIKEFSQKSKKNQGTFAIWTPSWKIFLFLKYSYRNQAIKNDVSKEKRGLRWKLLTLFLKLEKFAKISEKVSISGFTEFSFYWKRKIKKI